MTTPNIDLAEICPEIIEALSEVQRIINHFKNSPSWQRSQEHLDELLNKSQVKLTFAEIKAIAATMLRLATENERLKAELTIKKTQRRWV